jgi:hypothetical protein
MGGVDGAYDRILRLQLHDMRNNQMVATTSRRRRELALVPENRYTGMFRVAVVGIATAFGVCLILCNDYINFCLK